MSKLSTGTAFTENFVFNSGFLTIGGNQFVDLENISINVDWTQKDFYRLNSITAGAIRRADFKCGLKGKVKSFNRQLLGYAFGSSSADGTGTMYPMKDGQYDTTLNPILTVYVGDNTLQAWQYQFTDAIITKLPLTVTMEDFGVLDFEMVARQLSVYTDAFAS